MSVVWHARLYPWFCSRSILWFYTWQAIVGNGHIPILKLRKVPVIAQVGIAWNLL
jgi:hypothetical protein